MEALRPGHMSHTFVPWRGLFGGPNQARWTEAGDKANPETPTAVLVHGILGARKNWGKVP